MILNINPEQEFLETIDAKLKEGKRLTRIAQELGKDKAYVSRKIKESGHKVKWTGRLVPRELPSLDAKTV
jgi:hypothetical protein